MSIKLQMNKVQGLLKEDVESLQSVLRDNQPILQFIPSPLLQEEKEVRKIENYPVPDVDTDWYISKVDDNATDEIIDSVPDEFLQYPVSVTRWWNQESTFSKEEEKFIFLKYNYFRMKAKQLRDQIQKKQTKALIREMLFYYKQIARIESVLVAANLKIVISTVTETKYRFLHQGGWNELISEGNEALLNAVRNFDVERNCRFSTVAWNCVKNAIIDFVTEKKKIKDHEIQQGENYDFEANPPHEHCSRKLSDLISMITTCNIADLTKKEMIILKARYPLDGSERKPLRILADKFKVSIPTVVRMEQQLMLKLRNFLVENAEKFEISEEIL